MSLAPRLDLWQVAAPHPPGGFRPQATRSVPLPPHCGLFGGFVSYSNEGTKSNNDATVITTNVTAQNRLHREVFEHRNIAQKRRLCKDRPDRTVEPAYVRTSERATQN